MNGQLLTSFLSNMEAMKQEKKTFLVEEAGIPLLRLFLTQCKVLFFFICFSPPPCVTTLLRVVKGKKKQPQRSWFQIGGEAVRIFIQPLHHVSLKKKEGTEVAGGHAFELAKRLWELCFRFALPLVNAWLVGVLKKKKKGGCEVHWIYWNKAIG